MSIKLGNRLYEYVLLHFRNGENYAGMVEVAEDLQCDSEDSQSMQAYYKAMAADLMQPKVMTDTSLDPADDRVVDRIIILRNPHQVMFAVGKGQTQIMTIPLSYGNMVIYPRAAEVLFPQFLDDSSPIVKEIRAAQSPIKRPADGLATTSGGLVLPGQGGTGQ